jgi:hypothetical protein
MVFALAQQLNEIIRAMQPARDTRNKTTLSLLLGAGAFVLDAITSVEGTCGAAYGSNRKSFDPETPVLLADGTSKPIKNIRVGDKVTATEPTTGHTQAQTVTAIHINHDTDLLDLLVTDKHGHTTTLHTTQHHPVWDQTRHTWTDAAALPTGDQLRSHSATMAKVTAARPVPGEADMYNLTIADIHTYYVMAGNTPVLVHNCGDGPGRDLIPGEDQQHIISGNSTGGGHKWPGQPGKRVFPASWDTDTILDNVADVATDPNSTWTWQTGRQGSLYTRAGDPSRVRIDGVRDGVNIRVIFEPATGRFVTAFPVP